MAQYDQQNPVISINPKSLLMDPAWVRAVRQADMLIGAVLRSDLETVNQLVESGVNPNQGNTWDERPLHHTAKIKNPGPMIDLLVMQGADPGLTDHIGNAPIHWAAIYRNSAAVEALISHPINPTDPNLPGQLLQTPLLIAIELGDVPTADVILRHPKTNLDQANAYGTDAWKMVEIFCPKYAGQHEQILSLFKSRMKRTDTSPLSTAAAGNLDHWRAGQETKVETLPATMAQVRTRLGGL